MYYLLYYGVSVLLIQISQRSSLFSTTILLKMHFTLGLSSLLLLSLSSSVFAIAIEPSDNLSVINTGYGRNGSLTSSAPSLSISPTCISQAEHPDWAGTMLSNDCKSAFLDLEDRVWAVRDHEFTFWSKKFESSPPHNGWKLPTGGTYGKPFSVHF